MPLSEWDRAYIEHLIRRDDPARSRDHQSKLHMFNGADWYFWNFRKWPKPEGVEPHHEYMVINCPDCGLRQDLALHSCDSEVNHKEGCPFFRAEQHQWVDDEVDVRHLTPQPLVRDLTWTEVTLLTTWGVHSDPSSAFQMSITREDGFLLREVIARTTPHVHA